MVASATIGALGSLASTALGMFGAHQSAYRQYKYQSKLQQQSADMNYNYSKKLTKWQQKYSPLYTRQGLEKAGYNPLLALGTNIGGAGTSFTGTGQATAPDYNEGLSSALDFLHYRREKEKTDAEIKNLNQNTRVQELQGEDVAEDIYHKTVYNQLAEQFAKEDLTAKELTNRLTLSSALGQETINKYLPDKLKSEIHSYITGANAQATSANAQMINAKTGRMIAPSVINKNTESAYGIMLENADLERYLKDLHGSGYGTGINRKLRDIGRILRGR